MLTSFVFCDTFVELSLGAFSSLVLVLFSFRRILMRPGRVIIMIATLSACCVFLGSSLIAWKTKKQTAVSRSSAEAELRAMATVTAEVTWLRWLLEDFGVPATAPTPLSSDSTGAISIARDPVKHELTKHIGVDASYMRSQVHDLVVTLHHVPSEVQLADFFTKAQTRAHHSFLLSKLSVVDPP